MSRLRSSSEDLTLTDKLVFTEGILRTRGISRCSAAPDRQARSSGRTAVRSLAHTPNPTRRPGGPSSIPGGLPFSVAPKRFQKTALTEEGAGTRTGARSPLYDALRQRTPLPYRRPPLSLNKGHTSLLLMTGMLDGYVPSSPPHVVRGLTCKVEKLHR